MGNQDSTLFEEAEIHDADSLGQLDHVRHYPTNLSESRILMNKNVPRVILTGPDQHDSWMKLEVQSRNSSNEELSLAYTESTEPQKNRFLFNNKRCSLETETLLTVADDTLQEVEKELCKLNPEEQAHIEEVLARVRQLDSKDDSTLKDLKTHFNKPENKLNKGIRTFMSSQDINKRIVICCKCHKKSLQDAFHSNSDMDSIYFLCEECSLIIGKQQPVPRSPVERSSSYSKFEHLLESNKNWDSNLVHTDSLPGSTESDENPFIASGTKNEDFISSSTPECESAENKISSNSPQEDEEPKSIDPETAKRRASLRLIQFRGNNSQIGSNSTSGSTAEYGGSSSTNFRSTYDPTSSTDTDKIIAINSRQEEKERTSMYFKPMIRIHETPECLAQSSCSFFPTIMPLADVSPVNMKKEMSLDEEHGSSENQIPAKNPLSVSHISFEEKLNQTEEFLQDANQQFSVPMEDHLLSPDTTVIKSLLNKSRNRGYSNKSSKDSLDQDWTEASEVDENVFSHRRTNYPESVFSDQMIEKTKQNLAIIEKPVYQPEPKHQMIIYMASQSSSTGDENTSLDEPYEELYQTGNFESYEIPDLMIKPEFEESLFHDQFTDRKISPIRSVELKKHRNILKSQQIGEKQDNLNFEGYSVEHEQNFFMDQDPHTDFEDYQREEDSLNYHQNSWFNDAYFKNKMRYNENYYMDENETMLIPNMTSEEMQFVLREQENAWTNMYSLSAQVIESAKEFSAKLDELSYEEDTEPYNQTSIGETISNEDYCHGMGTSQAMELSQLQDAGNDECRLNDSDYGDSIYQELINFKTGGFCDDNLVSLKMYSPEQNLDRMTLNQPLKHNDPTEMSAIPSPSVSEISNATTVLQRHIQSCHTETTDTHPTSSVTPTMVRRRSLTRSLALGEAPCVAIAPIRNKDPPSQPLMSPQQLECGSTDTLSSTSTGKEQFFFSWSNDDLIKPLTSVNSDIVTRTDKSECDSGIFGIKETYSLGVQFEGISERKDRHERLLSETECSTHSRHGELKSEQHCVDYTRDVGNMQLLNTSISKVEQANTATHQSESRSPRSRENGVSSPNHIISEHCPREAQLLPDKSRPKDSSIQQAADYSSTSNEYSEFGKINLEDFNSEDLPVLKKANSKLEILDQSSVVNLSIDEQLALIDQLTIDCSTLGHISPSASVELLSNVSEEPSNSIKLTDIEEDDVTLPELNPLSLEDLSVQASPIFDQYIDKKPNVSNSSFDLAREGSVTPQLPVKRTALTPDPYRSNFESQNEIKDFLESRHGDSLAEIRNLEDKLCELRALEQEQIDEIQAKIASIMSSPSGISSSSIEHGQNSKYYPTAGNNRMLMSRGVVPPRTYNGRSTIRSAMSSKRHHFDNGAAPFERISLDDYTTSGQDSGGSGGHSYSLRGNYSSRTRIPIARLTGSSQPHHSELNSASEYPHRSFRMRRGSWHTLYDKSPVTFRSSWSDHGEESLDEMNLRDNAGIRSSLGSYEKGKYSSYDPNFASLQRYHSSSRAPLKPASLSRSTEHLSTGAASLRMRPNPSSAYYRSKSLNRSTTNSMENLGLLESKIPNFEDEIFGDTGPSKARREQHASTERLRRQVEKEHRKLLKSLMEDQKNSNSSLVPSFKKFPTAEAGSVNNIPLSAPIFSTAMTKPPNNTLLNSHQLQPHILPQDPSVYVPGQNILYYPSADMFHQGLIESGLNPNSLLAQTLANSEALDSAITSNQITLAAIAGTIAAMAGQQNSQLGGFNSSGLRLPQADQDRLLQILLSALNRNQATLDFHPTPELLQLLANKLKDGSIKPSDIPGKWLGINILDEIARKSHPYLGFMNDYDNFDGQQLSSNRSGLIKKTRWHDLIELGDVQNGSDARVQNRSRFAKIQIRYNFPTKRLLLMRDPKDRFCRGNGLGMRIIGGQIRSDGQLGAFVEEILVDGPAEHLHGEILDGDEILEWNGISLVGKTFEEVQNLISAPTEEIELVVRVRQDRDLPSYSTSKRNYHMKSNHYHRMVPHEESRMMSGMQHPTSQLSGGQMIGMGTDSLPTDIIAQNRYQPMMSLPSNQPMVSQQQIVPQNLFPMAPQTNVPLMMCEHHRQHHAAQMAMANNAAMMSAQQHLGMNRGTVGIQNTSMSAPSYHPHHHYHHLPPPGNLMPTNPHFQHMGNGVGQIPMIAHNPLMKPNVIHNNQANLRMPQQQQSLMQNIPAQNAVQGMSSFTAKPNLDVKMTQPALNNVLGSLSNPQQSSKTNQLLNVTNKNSKPTTNIVPSLSNVTDVNPVQPDEFDEDGPYGEIQCFTCLCFDDFDQSLTVHIAKARNLRPMDLNGLADPFVKVRLHPDPTEDPDFNRQTKYIDNSLEPEWQQTMVFMNCLKKSLKKRALEITVWDFDRLKTNDFMGQAIIFFTNDRYLDGQPHWHELHAMKEIVIPGLNPGSISSNPKNAQFLKSMKDQQKHLSRKQTTGRFNPT